MRSPVHFIKKVACTLYYLRDEGGMRKTANAVGVSRQTVSKSVREVCRAITIYLGPDYIKLPLMALEVYNHVTAFYSPYGIP